MTRPSNTIRPLVGPYNPRMVRASVDFPQPLSPTTVTASPRASWKSTPSTARTWPTGKRPNRLMSNHLYNPSTDSKMSSGLVPSGRVLSVTCTVVWLFIAYLAPHYAYSQHLTRQPSTTVIGGSCEHFSNRAGQRSAKRQPVGGLIKLGGEPGMCCNSLSCFSDGTLAISIFEYGCSGAV